MFKPKVPKKLIQKRNIKQYTLDTYHAKKLDDFNKDESEVLPQLLKEKQKTAKKNKKTSR